MTSFARIELSDQYPATIRALNQHGNVSDDYRAQSISKSLRSPRWQRLSGFARAQALHDYVGVLNRDWDDDAARAWQPTPKALADLRVRLQALPASAGDDLIVALNQELSHTELFDSFDEFQRSDDDRPFDELEQYDIWFSRNSPYLALGLSEDVEVAETELRQRVDYFLQRMPTGVGLTKTYTDRAWDYARAAYAEMRKAAGLSR